MKQPSHVIYLQESSRSTKKWMVTITKDGDRNFTVHFGGKGYSDYTLHKDPDRMRRYEARHNTKEDWLFLKTNGWHINTSSMITFL